MPILMVMKTALFLGLLLLFLGVNAQQSECLTAIEQVRQDSLLRFVRMLTGREAVTVSGQQRMISSRYAYHPDNDVAANYLKEACSGYGFSIQDIPFSSTGRNIIAYKNGTLSDKQAYILCAHYDCVGSSNALFQGADDNASGAAALLEAARVLTSTNFPYTIVLAFWDEEEEGLIGSMAFAPDGPLGYWDVAGVVNMDMIAWDGNNDSLAMIHAMPVASSASLALKMIEMNMKYQTGLQTVIQNPGETNTDQQSFWLKGATAVGLTEDYENDFNPHWHQWSDNLENMHLPYFTKVSKLAIAAICDLGKTGKVTGIGTVAAQSFMIYPNPVSTVLSVQTNLHLTGTSVMVYDMTGEEQMNASFTGGLIELNTSELRPGIYVAEVRADDQSFRYKFIKVAR